LVVHDSGEGHIVRAAASILVVAALGVALTACSGGGGTTSNGASDNCTVTPTGPLAASVTVAGDFGSKPEVTIDSPLAVETTERAVLIQGDGDLVETGANVRVDYQLYDAGTGAAIGGTEFTDGSAQLLPMDAAQLIPGIVDVLNCTPVGSRVVGVIESADAWGSQGQPDLGVAADTDVVFVADVVELSPPPLDRADGADQPPVDGMPTVVLDANGAPTITIPATAPPAEFQLAVLKQGDGPIVGEGADVVVHYTGINWNTGVIFDSSWEKGAPATFNTRKVIGGFTAALEGQAVGSQVLVVIPPDQGYGAAGNPPDIGGTDTIVFVVDILGIA
jgi:peptidylprolyl isomerase